MFWEGNVLLKFLKGKCTISEETEIENWLKESDQNKNTLSHLKMMLENQL
ncbi:MAG: hypothetical protein RLZZ337_959 [Bacteroidota bacterium]|jgi:hypothetical protein